MAALGSILEVTVAADFQAGDEVENEKVKNTSLLCVSNLVNGTGLCWGGFKAYVHVMPL